MRRKVTRIKRRGMRVVIVTAPETGAEVRRTETAGRRGETVVPVAALAVSLVLTRAVTPVLIAADPEAEIGARNRTGRRKIKKGKINHEYLSGIFIAIIIIAKQLKRIRIKKTKKGLKIIKMHTCLFS